MAQYVTTWFGDQPKDEPGFGENAILTIRPRLALATTARLLRLSRVLIPDNFSPPLSIQVVANRPMHGKAKTRCRFATIELAAIIAESMKHDCNWSSRPTVAHRQQTAMSVSV